MNTLKSEPLVSGYYWWLPEFLAENPKDSRNWEVIFCSQEVNRGRVGVFVGPIKAPTDLDLTNAE